MEFNGSLGSISITKPICYLILFNNDVNAILFYSTLLLILLWKTYLEKKSDFEPTNTQKLILMSWAAAAV